MSSNIPFAREILWAAMDEVDEDVKNRMILKAIGHMTRRQPEHRARSKSRPMTRDMKAKAS